MTEFELLNTIYENLNQRRNEILKCLKVYGYECKCGYYSQHSIRFNNEWLIEQYPIPVITVKGFGDVGIDINHIFLEVIISRSQGLSFDFNKLRDYHFEVYGIDDFKMDFYNSKGSIATIHSKISDSEENEIGISFFFPKDTEGSRVCLAINDIVGLLIATSNEVELLGV